MAKSAGRSKVYWFNFSSECNASSKPEIKLINNICRYNYKK